VDDFFEFLNRISGGVNDYLHPAPAIVSKHLKKRLSWMSSMFLLRLLPVGHIHPDPVVWGIRQMNYPAACCGVVHLLGVLTPVQVF